MTKIKNLKVGKMYRLDAEGENDDFYVGYFREKWHQFLLFECVDPCGRFCYLRFFDKNQVTITSNGRYIKRMMAYSEIHETAGDYDGFHLLDRWRNINFKRLEGNYLQVLEKGADDSEDAIVKVAKVHEDTGRLEVKSLKNKWFQETAFNYTLKKPEKWDKKRLKDFKWVTIESVNFEMLRRLKKKSEWIN